MGDRKPPKTSSGSNDKHKAKLAKKETARLESIKPDEKPKGKKN